MNPTAKTSTLNLTEFDRPILSASKETPKGSTISEFIELAQGAAEVTWPFGYDLQVPFETNVLRTAVLVANLHVCRAAEEMEQKVGMGSASPTVPVPTNQAERDPSSGSTPAQAVVIEHREDGQRIATLDIPSGKLEYFGPTDAEPKSPASSPDGRTVTYRTGRTLVLHGQGGSAGSSGSRESRPASVNSLCFYPSGKWIAAALPDALVILPNVPSGVEPHSRRVPMAKGCRLFDLLWSQDEGTLLALCYPAPNTKESQLLRIRLDSLQSTVQPASVNRLLGWHSKFGLLVVRAGVGKEEVGSMSSSGEFRSIREPEEGEFINDYIQRTEQVVITLASEDTSDPTRIRLANLEDHSARPWLENFPRLADLEFSRGWSLGHVRQSSARSSPIYQVAISTSLVWVGKKRNAC